jgi:hypothetical protein
MESAFAVAQLRKPRKMGQRQVVTVHGNNRTKGEASPLREFTNACLAAEERPFQGRVRPSKPGRASVPSKCPANSILPQPLEVAFFEGLVPHCFCCRCGIFPLGGPGRVRTYALRSQSPLLFQLSYRPTLASGNITLVSNPQQDNSPRSGSRSPWYPSLRVDAHP